MLQFYFLHRMNRTLQKQQPQQIILYNARVVYYEPDVRCTPMKYMYIVNVNKFTFIAYPTVFAIIFILAYDGAWNEGSSGCAFCSCFVLHRCKSIGKEGAFRFYIYECECNT